MNIPAEFIVANVLDLREGSREGTILYTLQKEYFPGSVTLRDGARLYPISSKRKASSICWRATRHPTSLRIPWLKTLRSRYAYFHGMEPIHFNDDHPDYSDGAYVPVNKTYEWMWTLSDIVNALIQSGLTIEMLNEYPGSYYQAFPGMTRAEDGWWELGKYRGMVPLTFSLRARKLGKQPNKGRHDTSSLSTSRLGHT